MTIKANADSLKANPFQLIDTLPSYVYRASRLRRSVTHARHVARRTRDGEGPSAFPPARLAMMATPSTLSTWTTTRVPVTCRGARLASVAPGAAALRARVSSASRVPNSSDRIARVGSLAARAAADPEPTPPRKMASKEKFSNATKMRSEAQAPFRVARMFVFGAFAANAGLGFGIASLQAVTKALGAPAAPPLDQSLQNVGINLACALFFGFLYKRDEEGRERQMARISREERLSALKCELGGGKVVSLYDLRGFSRVVVAAGDAEYCVAAVAAAETVREPLVERGVLVVPVVLPGGDAGDAAAVPPPTKDDKRFRASPVSVDKWARWIEEQKAEAKVAAGKGVYVGLRMDGRVRSSGTGIPPWDRFAVELPPTDSWGGVMDGFDGRVGVDT